MSAASAAVGVRERPTTTAIFFVNGLGIGAWAVCIPAFKSGLGLSPATLSLVLFSFALGAVVSMPIAGLLAARSGTGPATRLACLGFAVCLPLPALTGSLAGLSAAALALGCANGSMDVAMNAHASGVEQRGGKPVMSSIHAAFSAGGLSGAALGAACAATGASASDMLLGASCAGAAVLALTWPVLGRSGERGRPATLARPSRDLLPLCAAAILCMLCEGAMTDWSAVYLANGIGSGRAVAAVGYAAFSASMVIGRLAGDRVVRALGRPRVIGGGGALAAAGLLAAAVTPSPWPAVAGFGLVGLGLSNVVPAVFSMAGARTASPATGIAGVASAGYAGFLIGPPVVGVVATATGLRAGMGLLAAAAALIAVALPRAARGPGRADRCG